MRARPGRSNCLDHRQWRRGLVFRSRPGTVPHRRAHMSAAMSPKTPKSLKSLKSLKTRLTEFFDIEHPILAAPMAFISGGRLAATATPGGGLGLIGGVYGDSDWLQREFALAEGTRVGCGFITWSLARKPELLDQTLERQPATIMLSFGDLQPFAARTHSARLPP